ncbi:hypothetical protein Z946_626 [Sulfitobacter noctilucicola]|uniref:Uncharacterized protein n=1 Tax=Sulfitobacter noctilucicola TaxID=1342301 RepID=A0A7W6MB64_9RHOB|nr:hypothetical protein [Sulfitobacter noctilucicola]KIN66147.1 hypothetical protein Z946_626 [Sulfitobacter noctilucicola]MBB4175826.1 hypothetical protein [Sulfitobacter noctilucicola]
MPKDDAKSPDDITKELKDILAMAKKGPFFAVALGKEDPAFLVDKVKKPDVLAQKAKTEAKSSKLTYGNLEFEKGALTLYCQVNPPGNMMRSLKAYFKKYKVGAKFRFVLPDGTVEDDGADDGTGEIVKSFGRLIDGARQAANGDAARLKQIDGLQHLFDRAMESDPPDVDGAKKLIAAARKFAFTADDTGEGSEIKKTLVKSNTNWGKAVAAARSEVTKLESKVKTDCADLPGATRLDGAFKTLLSALDSLEKALAGPLTAGTATDDAKVHELARKKAMGAVDQVEKVLGSSPMFKSLDDNPFVKVQASRLLTGTLASIKKDLAA